MLLNYLCGFCLHIHSYKRLLSISHLILYITDDNLLNYTIRLLKESIPLINEKQIEKPLYNVLKNLIYSEEDCTRIRAFVYSNLLMFEVKINHWEDSFKGDFPKLRFKMDGRNLYINNNDINIVLKNNIVNYVVNDVIEILESQNQIKEFKKFIKSMAYVDHSNDTNYFKSDIRYLSILKKNIIGDLPKAETSFNTKQNKDYKKRVWFKVGLLFATGKMEKYYDEKKLSIHKNYSAPRIASELGNDGYSKYILATINGYKIGNKNIYNSFDKMQKIIKHCEGEKIKVIKSFYNRLPSE
jgi:hypothetical protein